VPVCKDQGIVVDTVLM